MGSIQLARKREGVGVIGIRRIGTSCGSRAVWFDLMLINPDCFSKFFYHSSNSTSEIKANETVMGRDKSFWGDQED